MAERDRWLPMRDEHDRIIESEVWILSESDRVRALENLGSDLLTLLGYDITGDALKDTPRRWAKMWSEFINYDAGSVDTCFENVTANQMIVVRKMRIWSMCEHHLLPFWCDVSIGYIPAGKVLGLSKFARIAHQAAHRLQLQERLVEDIASKVREVTGSSDVAVAAEGEHLCMTMRGVKTPATHVCSALSGAFRENASARSEFFALAGYTGR